MVARATGKGTIMNYGLLLAIKTIKTVAIVDVGPGGGETTAWSGSPVDLLIANRDDAAIEAALSEILDGDGAVLVAQGRMLRIVDEVKP